MENKEPKEGNDVRCFTCGKKISRGIMHEYGWRTYRMKTPAKFGKVNKWDIGECNWDLVLCPACDTAENRTKIHLASAGGFGTPPLNIHSPPLHKTRPRPGEKE